MTSQTLLRATLVLWTIAFILSFLEFQSATPGDSVATGGLGAVGWFVLWQVIACALAVFCWGLGSRFEKRTAQRIASRIPGIIAIAIVIAFALFAGTAGLLNGLAGA